MFVSDREGHDEIWLHDFRSGTDTVLTATSPEERAARKDPTPYTFKPSWPILSQDGLQVAYRVLQPSAGANKQSIYVVPVGGRDGALACVDCGGPTGWSADGQTILFEPGLRRTPIKFLHLPSGRQQELLTHPSYSLHQATFSPDDGWIAFHADLGGGKTRVYIAPYLPAGTVPDSEWISVIPEEQSKFMPRWSPDGNTLYFLSTHNGVLSIYARRLARATKHPTGDRFLVHRFGDSRHPPSARFSFGVSRDKIVFSLDELSTSIWMIGSTRDDRWARGFTTIRSSLGRRSGEATNME